MPEQKAPRALVQCFRCFMDAKTKASDDLAKRGIHMLFQTCLFLKNDSTSLWKEKQQNIALQSSWQREGACRHAVSV